MGCTSYKDAEAQLNELMRVLTAIRRDVPPAKYDEVDSLVDMCQNAYEVARKVVLTDTVQRACQAATTERNACVPPLQAAYYRLVPGAQTQDFVPQTGASMYMSPYTYLSTSVEPAESFLDKWMPKIMGKEDTDLFMTQTEWTLDPETNQQFIDWQKKNEEWLASTGGWSPGEVHPDVAQAEAKKAQYKSDVRNSSNPTAEMTKPGPDRVAASKGLTPEQMTALVGMMFTGVDQFQQQQLKMELLRAQSQGVPVQAPPVVLQQAQQQAQTPVALIAIIGIGVLAAGAMAFLAMR